MDRSFVFFDRRTGQILATHTQVSVDGEDTNVDTDELRGSYRASPGQEIDLADIDVLDVDLELLKRGTSNSVFVVDVDSRQVVRGKKVDSAQ